MQRIAIVLTLIAGLLVPQLAAMTVDQIIAKNIESRGGLEAMQAAKSMRMTGTLSLGQGMEAPLLMETQRPNKLRLEFTIQGMTGIQATDGETGWSVMPFMGKTEPEPMAEGELQQVQEQADLDGPLVNYKEKGHKVELVGTEEVEGTEAYKLHVTLANGNTLTTYLDTEYCLEFRQEAKRELQGTMLDLTTTIGDYKEVAGIMIPHSIEQQIAGMPAPQTIAIHDVEVNPEITADRFAMPAPATDEAAE